MFAELQVLRVRNLHITIHTESLYIFTIYILASSLCLLAENVSLKIFTLNVDKFIFVSLTLFSFLEDIEEIECSPKSLPWSALAWMGCNLYTQ